jgi:RNA-directed DNA polymerase
VKEGKSFLISKHQVLEAYRLVKANRGACGIDGIDFDKYEANLKGNLYKLWNRMSSGSYFPKAVKGVEIPKKNGKMRLLGIPTIEDRVAQMVVKLNFEPLVEPIFYDDSYGYRPNKSAIDAVGVTRERCWKIPWVVEYDIVGLFDNIDHELMMRAVRGHTKEKWIILYIERFLKAPIIMPNGEKRERTRGTPQGGAISPVLANLFLHYAIDRWITRRFPNNPWVRYADDGVIHCRTKEEAENILAELGKRMKECGLEIHPEKSRIVYCRSDRFRGHHGNETFDFLGYTFRMRSVRNAEGKFFNSFTPAVSKTAAKSFREKVRKLVKGTQAMTLEDLALQLNPVIKGWMNYFSVFRSREARKEMDYVNQTLVRWVKRHYKTVRRSWGKAWRMLARVAEFTPSLFYHWQKGIRPTIG